MRKSLCLVALAVCVAALGAAPAGAQEGFGLSGLDVASTGADGTPSMQAGTHPFGFTVDLDANTEFDPELGDEVPIGAVKDLKISAPAGLVANPNAVPRCSAAVFLGGADGGPACPAETVVGTTDLVIAPQGPEFEGPETFTVPVYNLIPPPGKVLKLGFLTVHVPVTVDAGLAQAPPYNGVVEVDNIAQGVFFYGSSTTLWGNPASPVHDAERGTCAESAAADSCPVSLLERPFLTLPRSCTGPLEMLFEADSWQDPGTWLSYSAQTHDESDPPNPLGLSDCAKLGFAPQLDAEPSTDQAESPAGADVVVEIDDPGIDNPTGSAQSDMKKAVLTLPEGVTLNPSQAEGLGVCSPAGFAAEQVDSQPGTGCPQSSKVGEVEAQSPILEGKTFKGQLFVAEPHNNPFNSLIALYMVIRDPELGILVKLPGKVEPDPTTGQIVTTFGEAPYELPQLPISSVRVHLREGGRSPLITPPACGTYVTKATFTPWADPTRPFVATSSFQITRGVGGAPCPPAGPPPFAPGLQAGSLNNAAGAHSPFYLRLTRRDGDQDLTRFSATLPAGMVATLAGTTMCPEAAIAVAKAKSGKAEQSSPSCPDSAQIGRVSGGAGVGSQLTYVPGKLYLAGPTNGAPLSVVAIVPAVAGPFDVGNVVVRQALRVNPRSGVVTVDGAASDPLPHILAGIPLKVRDIRAYVDKPDFTLNPTSCDPSAVSAEIWGGGSNPFSLLDDGPVSVAERFQIAGCAALGFKPKLDLRLKGGTKRGGHPALKGTYRPRPGDANLESLVLRLPRSAFLDQAHIRTICTRVQFAAKSCPPGAIYGKARAFTPILEAPLEGPVYLRSSDNNLPDFVADLKGLVDVEAVARIDSVRGGIRATFEDVPDAPLTKVVVSMRGGKKGLIVNSTSLCGKKKHRANADLAGHNGKRARIRPLMRASCGKGRKAARSNHSRARGSR